MGESILAWHFSDGELRFDYAGVKVEAGLVLETQEKPVIGRKGFHASEKAIDALSWFSISPSEKIVVSRVRLSGDMVTDKSSYGERLSAQKREHLWVADAKASIPEFIATQKKIIENLRSLETIYEVERWFFTEYENRYQSRHSYLMKKAEEIFKPQSNRGLPYLATVFAADLDIIQRDIYHLSIWNDARQDEFDLQGYFRDLERQEVERRKEKQALAVKKRLKNRFQGVLGELDTSSVRDKAWENPPQAYGELMPKPRYANELFHEMLMRLAPEGYEE